MKTLKTALFASLFICLLLSACSDDTPGSGQDEYPGLDNFEGRIKEFFLTEETYDFHATDCTLRLLAPDNSVITRQCSHTRRQGVSAFHLTTGLKEGEYRLLYLEYPIDPVAGPDGKPVESRQFGLGSSITVTAGGVDVTSIYSSEMGLSGKGTEEDPYIISSYDHLMNLAHKVNSDLSNSLITEETFFQQIVDIDMDDASFFTDHRYGWEPIGNDVNLPFRGVYKGARLSNIWSLRDHSPAVGLFGYIHRARIDGVTIDRGEFTGNFAVGAVAGASVTAGNKRDCSQITNCRVVNSTIAGSSGSMAIGGILGVADMESKIILYECHNENTAVSGDYNIGGIMGASSAYSLASVNNCSNSGRIEGGFSGVGGIAGTCDTIYVTSCRNLGDVRGGEAYNSGDTKNAATGTGGVIGGSGTAFVTGCTNSGTVTGRTGVGGMLGSCRVAGDSNGGLIYNNAAFRYCSNYADVKGDLFVGGICGESQFGCYGVINRGNVTGDSYIGGIAGNTSLAVAHNAINTGKVSGTDYVAGIVGKTTFGSLAINDNYGEISASGSHTAGIVGMAGNNTIIHYCGNHGFICNPAGKYIGGIVGEIGDPRKWTGWNIAECVVGAADIVLCVLGPCIGVAEHLLEESQHVISLILKYGEFSFDMLLHATDVVLWSNSTYEMICGESPEEVSSAISAVTLALANDINDEMAGLRSGSNSYSVTGVSADPLSHTRATAVNSLTEWYSRSGNDDEFNDAINEMRFERMEDIEKVEKAKEIAFQCIGGVCMVVGTVATIGATVASGGVATAFMVTGMMVGIVGGLNAIVKSCSEFEANVVIISQCVNSGDIKGNSNAGALAGSLHDCTILRDCINLGDGTGHEKVFASHFGQRAGATRCVNAGKNWSGDDLGSLVDNTSGVIRKDGAHCGDGPFEMAGSNLIYIDASALNHADLYRKVDSSWDISSSEQSRWTLPSMAYSGILYPVPSYSEMRK
ncbi:MAG: hypothetical protein K2M07_08860 [Muribaculaceae bacterium]|nr:hypothetical protein [Muribaculaceae bacterium]